MAASTVGLPLQEPPRSERKKTSYLRDLFERRDEIRDQCLNYSADEITSWNVLFKVSGTIWTRNTLWMTAVHMLCLSALMGVTVLLIMKDPAALDAGKFLKLASFLNVFVGLLLGLFISSSVHRWFGCTDGFASLCFAVENLQRELVVLQVDEQKINTILRYSVLAGTLLDLQLRVEWLPRKDNVQEDAQIEMWEMLSENVDPLFGSIIHHDEAVTLMSQTDPSSAVMMWVGSLVARLAKEGLIPPTTSPAYCRLMGLVAQAHSGILHVRKTVCLQPPYLYVQMLAALVHTNNILNALSFGMTSGTTVGTILMYLGICVHADKDGCSATFGEMVRDIQNLLISLFFCCFGPLIYQALLETAMAIATPFSNVEACVPVRGRLQKLRNDLVDCQNHGKIMMAAR